jgi:surfeit locus 1 family protein
MRTNWNFRPEPVNTVLTIIALSAFICLGMWQTDRASQKRQIYDTFLLAQAVPPMEYSDILATGLSGKEIALRNITLSGKFVNNATYLLDNQVVGGIAGYQILSGFSISGSKRPVLINRGWIPAGDDRNVISPIKTPTDYIDITGRLIFPEDNWFIDENAAERLSNGIVRILEINVEKISADTKLNYLPFIILLDAEIRGGFDRKWPMPKSNELRHQGYAFQWFLMALAVLIIYLCTNLKKIN